jgi:hypothetical protein
LNRCIEINSGLSGIDVDIKRQATAATS